MRKIIVQEWISADGFATDREGTTKFFEDPKFNEGFNEFQEELFEHIDGALLGATTYKMFSAYCRPGGGTHNPAAKQPS